MGKDGDTKGIIPPRDISLSPKSCSPKRKQSSMSLPVSPEIKQSRTGRIMKILRLGSNEDCCTEIRSKGGGGGCCYEEIHSSQKSVEKCRNSFLSTWTFLLSVCFKGLVLMSVVGLIGATLFWFHVRLTSLEHELWTLKASKDRTIINNNGYYSDESRIPHLHSPDTSDTAKTGQKQEQQPPELLFSASPSASDINELSRLASSSLSSTSITHGLSQILKQTQRVKRRVDHGGQQRERPNFGNAHVEFINSKLREEMEKGGGGGNIDGEPSGSSSSHGQHHHQENNPNANPGNEEDWVWLTSYSRIPLMAIQDFCSATKTYCPTIPGPQGNPGLPGKSGSKGEKGEPGMKGEHGNRGHQGPPGLPGLRGPKGEPGIPGIGGADGRDGLPGEPGLDGVPGRNGLDGIPGIDGIPGLDGRPGIGRNGSDGIPGSAGPAGLTGPPGARGLPGPRGPSGLAGRDGSPGIPGINAWVVNNNTDRQQLLIPPSIVGSHTKMRPLVVHEGENVRLRCTATGVPRPAIKWKREDGSVIPLGSWKASSVDGPVVNLTRVNREHMGAYLCLADNGVTPHVQRTYVVEVHFPPLIRIQNQQVGASIGSVAMLDCYVEAFPTSVTYWERSDGRILEPSDKYQITIKETPPYKIHMMLNVTKVNGADFGRYHCISKNEMGITKGDFNVYVVDPSQVTPPPISVQGKGVAIYGQIPPELVDLEDLCPSPVPCPDCPRLDTGKCRSGGFALLDMVGWEMYPLGNLSTPLPNNRTQDCVLSAVGKPVFNRFSNFTAGCWMKDPVQSGINGEKYWVTLAEDTTRLYEFYNKSAYTQNHPTRNYTLPFPFRGNFHTVYNGSFFYVAGSEDGRPKIVRFDLITGKSNGDIELPYANFHKDHKLYTSDSSWVDLATDENGLWAVHTLQGSNNTAIVKIQIEPENMMILYGWNITISHVYAGDMFIICGVLYAVDSVTERETKIRLALDLYRRTLLKVDLGFSNPFRKTAMVSYNPRTKELFTWDKGNQLIYPIKYNDIGYDTSHDKKDEIHGLAFTNPPPVHQSQ